MEPGHEDREYVRGSRRAASLESPQWSPVMKTGNTGGTLTAVAGYAVPQWSPVMKTGNTYLGGIRGAPRTMPQWSPVMKTGNTWAGMRLSGILPSLNGARS